MAFVQASSKPGGPRGSNIYPALQGSHCKTKDEYENKIFVIFQKNFNKYFLSELL